MRRLTEAEMFDVVVNPSYADMLLDAAMDLRYGKRDIPEPALAMIRGVYANNAKIIHEFCESPIETAILKGIQTWCLLSCNLCQVYGPVDDFEEFISSHFEAQEYAFACGRQYELIPDDVRPSTLEEYLKALDLPAEAIKLASVEYRLMHQLGLFHSLTIALQPTIKRKQDGLRDIRPDMIVWVPSDPRVKTIVECDGYQYHHNKKSFVEDRKRDRWLSDHGYVVKRYAGAEVRQSFTRCGAELARSVMSQVASDRQEVWEQEACRKKKIGPLAEDEIAAWREYRAEQLEARQ